MDTARQDSSTRDQFLLGARLFLPVAISIAAYGVVWGVLARQAGLGVGEVALMSGLVFAGASQFVALELWAPGASLPIGAIVLATLIVNLRFLLMTATVRPLVAHLPLKRALPMMGLVSDENWAMTMAELKAGRGSAAFLMGSGVCCWLSWMISTLTGRVLGSAIDDPARFGLDFAFTATFLALLLGMWRGKSDIVPWMVAAVAAMVAARLIPGNWYILIGGLVGSFAGAVIEMRMGRRNAA